MKSGDSLVFTGDFNCGSETATIQKVASELECAITGDSYGGADHIFTNGLPVLSAVTVNGKPSDHNLVKASFRLPVPPVEEAVAKVLPHHEFNMMPVFVAAAGLIVAVTVVFLLNQRRILGSAGQTQVGGGLRKAR